MTALQHRLAQQQDELHAQGLAKAEAAASLSALEGDMDFLKQEHVAALAENAELKARLAWNMPHCSWRQGGVPQCGSERVFSYPHRPQCNAACLSIGIMEGAHLGSRWRAGSSSWQRCVWSALRLLPSFCKAL